jgi:hypothetical protein
MIINGLQKLKLFQISRLFREVLFGEQGLQIGVMEALPLLPWLKEIEWRTWFNVIEMPNLSVVIPSHP